MNVIFDFDGTIADSMPLFIAVFNKTIRGNTEPLTTEEIHAFRGMTSRQAIKSAGVRWWQVPKLITQGMPDFHAMSSELKPCEGVPDVIRELYNRGDSLFIVTSNTRESVDNFLINQNLDGFFEDIATSASIFNKSKSIRRLMKRNKLKRRDSLYVGDETRDVKAAKLALIKVVSVTWGFNSAKILKKQRPTYLIDDPKQLLDLPERKKK